MSFDFVTRMTLLVRNGQDDPKIDFYLVAESPRLKNLSQLSSFPPNYRGKKIQNTLNPPGKLGSGLAVSSQESLDLQSFCFKGEGFRKTVSHICSQVDVVIC